MFAYREPVAADDRDDHHEPEIGGAVLDGRQLLGKARTATMKPLQALDGR
jgi:hypothetical protein